MDAYYGVASRTANHAEVWLPTLVFSGYRMSRSTARNKIIPAVRTGPKIDKNRSVIARPVRFSVYAVDIIASCKQR